MVSDKVIYSCFNDIACFPGYLDDYAMLGSTLVDYLSISWSIKHYNLCKRICNDLVTNFEDKKRVDFFSHRTIMKNYFIVLNLFLMIQFPPG